MSHVIFHIFGPFLCDLDMGYKTEKVIQPPISIGITLQRGLNNYANFITLFQIRDKSSEVSTNHMSGRKICKVNNDSLFGMMLLLGETRQAEFLVPV